jgi:hypothetical protein
MRHCLNAQPQLSGAGVLKRAYNAGIQATLSFDAKGGERVGVTVKVHEDGPDVLICSLREGTSESQSLDLIFDS